MSVPNGNKEASVSVRNENMPDNTEESERENKGRNLLQSEEQLNGAEESDREHEGRGSLQSAERRKSPEKNDDRRHEGRDPLQHEEQHNNNVKRTRDSATVACGYCRHTESIFTTPAVRWHQAVVVLCACSLFFPCAWYSEWYIDELFAIVRNPDAKNESTWADVFSHDFWGNALWDKGWTHKSYRPMTVLSYGFQFWMNNEVKPQPLRAFNLCNHALNSFFLHKILYKLRAPAVAALLSALLFAAHPVHVENVVYSVGRADMMATTLWLACVDIYLDAVKVSASRALLITLLSVVAGLCKEVGFMILPFLAAVELVQQRYRGFAYLLVSFVCVCSARLSMTGGSQAGFSFVDTPVQYDQSFLVRALTYFEQHAIYGRLFLFPWNQSWDYSYDAIPLMKETVADVRMLNVATCYLCVLNVAAVTTLTRNMIAVFGFGWVLVAFLPASNLFFIVGVTVGERLLYPVSCGLSLLTAAVMKSFPKASPLVALWVCIFCINCSIRVSHWSNREHLFSADVASWPRSLKSHHQIATIYVKNKRYDEALHHFDMSIKFHDDNALTDYCIAQVYIFKKQPAQSLQRFEKIMAGHGIGFGGFNTFTLYVDYGYTLATIQEWDTAIDLLKQGLTMNADVPYGWNTLAFAYAHKEMWKESGDAIAQGLQWDPENPYLWNNIAAIWIITQNFEGARQALVKVLGKYPDYQMAQYNGNILHQVASNQQASFPQLDLFYDPMM